MVGLVIRLDEHAHHCTVSGPIIYQYSSKEVAELRLLGFFSSGIVATLEEFEMWRETLSPTELFDIIPIRVPSGG